MIMNNFQNTHQKRSPFIKKSLDQRLKDQDILIRNSSPHQLQRSLQSCQKNLSTTTFPETSEAYIVLKQFERKLLIRLNQLSEQVSNPTNATPNNMVSTSNDNSIDSSKRFMDHHQVKSIGSEGIVGFKRQLINEQSFVPTSESLLTGMPMSQSIRLQQQILYREREAAATEAMDRLTLQGSSSSNRLISEGNESQDGDIEAEGESDDDEIILAESDQPDIQKAWELAYQAGFTRGPGDLPQRMLPANVLLL